MRKAKTTINHELDEALNDLVGKPKMPVKKINIKQAPFDYGVRVDVIPGKEKIVWLLRNLEDDEFKYVIRAARQYRRADKVLKGIGE
jgi:hypothetical protein